MSVTAVGSGDTPEPFNFADAVERYRTNHQAATRAASAAMRALATSPAAAGGGAALTSAPDRGRDDD